MCAQLLFSRHKNAQGVAHKKCASYFFNDFMDLMPKNGKRGKFLGGWAWQGLGSVILPMDGVAP
jgi:hypothetical protein